MQITIEVEGDALKPDVQEIMAALTEEDRRSIAAQIARHYFLEDMKHNYGEPWNRDTGADRYIKELVREFKGAVATAVKEDPDLYKTVTETLEAVKEEFPGFVRIALGKMVTGMFAEMLTGGRETSMKFDALVDRLESLNVLTS